MPKSLFGLTILAWGNCLGDMSADMAMTKKGFGEMAITGTMAGPIFNILMGQGLSTTLKILSSDSPSTAAIHVSVFEKDGSFNKQAVLPLSLIVGELIVLGLCLFNALKNKFNIELKYTFIGATFYGILITGLVAFSIINAVDPGSG